MAIELNGKDILLVVLAAYASTYATRVANESYFATISGTLNFMVLVAASLVVPIIILHFFKIVKIV